jgi:hypothetical protein
MGLGANLALGVLDISQTGVRLVVKAPLEKGQEIELNLFITGVSRSFKGLAEVAWCFTRADGSYIVGARFRHPIPYGDFQQFVSPSGA